MNFVVTSILNFFVELNLDEAYENESYIESIFWIFNWKDPFLVYFEHFSGTFLIQPLSMFPWLLNWIIYWIESPQLFLNWIIVWIEFWETNIESNIELNQFLPKFKLWIESFWVSNRAIQWCFKWINGWDWVGKPGGGKYKHKAPFRVL